MSFLRAGHRCVEYFQLGPNIFALSLTPARIHWHNGLVDVIDMSLNTLPLNVDDGKVIPVTYAWCLVQRWWIAPSNHCV